MEDSRLKILLDQSINLQGKLDAALELFKDDSVNFPSRSQYMLTWLLDSIFRIMKGSPVHLKEILSQKTFWNLFEGVLEAAANSASTACHDPKKGKYSLCFDKPALPIFTKAFLHLDNQIDFQEQILQCMNLLLCRSDTFHRWAPYIIKEFIPALLRDTSSSVLVEASLSIITKWFSGQPKAQLPRILLEVKDEFFALLSLNCIQSTNCQVALQEAVFYEENINQVVSKLNSGDQNIEIMAHLLKFNINIGAIFNAFVQNLFLFMPDQGRIATSLLLQYLVQQPKGVESLPGMVQTLKNRDFARIQSDKSWKLIVQTFTELEDSAFNCPSLVAAIAELEINLISPDRLEKIFDHANIDSGKWTSAVLLMAKRLASIRLFDQYLGLIVTRCQDALFNESFYWNHLDLFRELHSSHFNELITKILIPNIQHTVATEFMCLLAAVFPNRLVTFLENIKFNERVMEKLVETISDLTLLDNVIDPTTFSKVHLILAARKNQNVSIDPVSWLQFLPLPSGSLPCNFLLSAPYWVFACTMFWEKFVDLDVIELEGVSHQSLIQLIQYKPFSVKLPSTFVQQALIQLSQSDQLESFVECALILLKGAPDLDVISNEVVNYILETGNEQLISLVYEKKLISIEVLYRYFVDGLEKGRECCSIEIIYKDLPVDLQPELLTLFKQYISKFTPLNQKIISTCAALIRSLNTAELQQSLLSLIIPNIQTDFNLELHLNTCLIESGIPSLQTKTLLDIVTLFLSNNNGSSIDPKLFSRHLKMIDIYPHIPTLLNLVTSLNESSIRLLDLLLLQRLEVQIACCPKVDSFITSVTGIKEDLMPVWIKLIQHRLGCGSVCIKMLQESDTFEALIKHISNIFNSKVATVGDLISLLNSSIHFHWESFIARRPVLISYLCQLLKFPNLCDLDLSRIAKLIHEMSLNRQNDSGLHFYLAPIFLTFSTITDSKIRRALRPSLCSLLRVYDQRKTLLEVDEMREHYFDLDPFEKLMRFAESDDSKFIIKDLLQLYKQEFKYTGKA